MTKSNAAMRDQRADPMGLALAQADAAAGRGEAPIGAVLVDGAGTVLAADGNRVEGDSDPSAHAEILVLRRAAAARGSPRLTDCTLYVTLEPCAMCAGAIAQARLKTVVFGAYDPKGGGVEHGARVFDRATCNHRPEIVGGVREGEAARRLKDFFRARR